MISKLYADDVKVYMSAETVATCLSFQGNLDKLMEWSETWQLPISIPKCNLLSLQSSHRRLAPMASYNYHLGSSELFKSTAVIDLGITVDSGLTFSHHINNITSKAYNRMNLLFRCFHSNCRDNLIRAYTVYIRPTLEYCSSVWSPYRLKDIKDIEKVQRKFTKRLNGLQYLPYAERLHVTKLESLQDRRIKSDLILTYKILFNHVNISSEQFFKLNDTVHNTRGHTYKLTVQPARIDVRKHFFSCRVVPIWNRLPDFIDFSSLTNFKNSVRSLHFTDSSHNSVATLFSSNC